ncbi:MAG: ABC transporter substrate-binding protein [Anaerolineae bacterium]
MNRLKIWLPLLFMLLVTGCGSSEPPIKIAISAWAGVEPAELAARLGYYEERGVEVEMVRFSAYTDSIEALRDGKTQAGMHTLDDAIRYFSAGRDVRVVLFTDYSYGGDGIVAREGINTVADLKGATVGAEIGTVGHFSLLKALELGGLTEEDINIVSIPAWEIKDAFLAGQIDAGVTWEPYLTSSAQEGNGNVIITSRDYPNSIVTTMVFDAETVARRPDDVKDVVAAYFDAVEFIEQNPGEAYRIMGEAEGIDAAEFASHVEGLRYLNLQDNHRVYGQNGQGPLYQTAAELADFLAEKGVINQAPSVNTLLEPQFVQALR